MNTEAQKAKILEENRLIAEFMEYSHSKYKDVDEWEMNNLMYRDSWIALMPVIEKIKGLHEDVRDFKSHTRCSAIIDGLINVDIFSSHAAVVQFIKWYNQPIK